ncbi:MAG TPA: CoA pyrophosphatase [Geobacteraceae bacterium]|nr:CoA pyrophosphatase [Geobacteraceae bacterium]
MAPGPVPSAVLVPVFLKNGEYHLLFTKRTENLNHHRGEISFPGGVRQPEDEDSLRTALRETREEVGIEPDGVEILGVLDDFYSIHGYLITPYVGMIPAACDYRVNSSEIERIIEVPLRHLLNPDIFRIEDWTWKGRTHPVFFYSYRGDEIWGVTAAILKQFLDLVFGPEKEVS